jgi:ribose-phosphate pyrophosphokinase
MTHPMTVFAGPASVQLGTAACRLLGVAPGAYECLYFPDGEAQVELRQSVRGHDVFIVQSTSPPVERHLMELLLLVDACRRAGAARTSAVIPYFGYARQERRAGRRALGARVAANVVAAAGLDRLMLIDAHTPAIEGFFDVPLDHLTAVPLLARTAAMSVESDAVIVAPDLGAVKRARAYAAALRLPMAFIHKTRLDGESVEAHSVAGDVGGRTPLIVDDMLSTGATIEAAVGALRRAGAAEPASVVVTHALVVGRARDVLDRLPLSRVIASDTVEIPEPLPRLLALTSAAPLVAQAIARQHGDESLADLRVPG